MTNNDLFERSNSMNWYAIYTKPKTEDVVSEKLTRAGIQVYNPKLKIKKYLRNKYCEVIEPLFPCYIFGKFEPEKYQWMITYTRGVRKIVGDKTYPWPVAEDIIDCIRCNEKDGLVTMRCEELREDDAVRISEGPLAGLTGVFKKIIKGSERVMLLLNTLEYQARVIVERASLIKVC
jgi:transcriptional antiterminator RfaH